MSTIPPSRGRQGAGDTPPVPPAGESVAPNASRTRGALSARARSGGAVREKQRASRAVLIAVGIHVVVGAVLVFGSSTLLLRSEDILKWKAPVVNWIMAIVFIASQYFSPTNMAKSMFGQMVTMPDQRWKLLNLAWAGVFLLVGSANLFVAFTFPDYWVDFKVFGSMGILLLASVLQIFYLYPYMEADKAEGDDKPDLKVQK